MPDSPGSLVEQLCRLLLDLLEPFELHRVLCSIEVEGRELGRDLADNLPPHNEKSKAEYFHAAATGLLRTGITQTLLDVLLEVRPARGREIESVMQRLERTPAESLVAPGAPPEPGNPFLPYAPFVGRETLLAELQQQLRGGQSTLLIGGRRAGKTMMLRELSEDGLGRRLVCADAAGWALDRGERAVLEGIGRALQVGVEDRTDLENALKAAVPLVLVIDEADRLLGHHWTGSLLAWLRSMDDSVLRADLAFVLAGGPELSRYRNPDDRGSPPLNTSRPMYLDALSQPARQQLLEHLDGELDQELLYREVGGQPWLLTRTLGQVWQGRSLEDALDDVFGLAQPQVETWRRQLGPTGLALLGRIAAGGLSREMFRRKGELASLRSSWDELRSLGLVTEEGGVLRVLSLCPGLLEDA